MSDTRPVNLDLFTINQPLPAIASIIHRISGLLLFVGVGGLLCLLDLSLESQASFNDLLVCLSGGFVKFVVWILAVALIYHFVAGIKHLMMDMGVGETLEGAQLSAKVVIAVSVILSIIAGVCIW